MARTKLWFILLTALLILPSCKPSWIIGKSAECREFYALPPPERQAKFETFPLEKQLRIYQCGMDREPPDSGRAYDIAGGGDKVIPHLLEQLKVEKDDYARDNIIYIFEIMSESRQLKGRQDIIDVVQEAVSSMTNEIRRNVSQERLETIQRNAKS